MKFVLGNFKLWRIKKFLVLLVCMGSSILAMFIINSDRLSSAFILAGLVLYAIIVDLPLIKQYSYTIYVEDKDTEIYKEKERRIFYKKNRYQRNFIKGYKIWRQVVRYYWI